MERVLVVFFSRNGTTSTIAHALATELHADIEELFDGQNRSGVRGYLRSGYEATFRRDVALRPLVLDPAGYDLVVVGTPVWNHSVSSPVRTFLRRNADRLPALALFATCNAWGATSVISQMASVAQQQPLATLALSAADIRRDGDRLVKTFARTIGSPPGPDGAVHRAFAF